MIVLLLSLALQCPDGSPPPCAARRAPDPNRIAILPFRVSAADSLLSEGIPELLSAEFTGGRGPRAAHMGTVLRAWRRAGGGLRTPLTQAAQLRLAREIDCGLIVEGSVVGLGSRLTLSASVVPVAGGAPRRVGPISGPPDSLESLVGRLASGLIGAAGSERATDSDARLTNSPPAMRAYLEGLSLYRRGTFGAAAPLFERALALDSGFARAALQLWLAAGWMGADGSAWSWVAYRNRERLSAADRVLLTAHLGERFPALRSPEQHLEDRRRAAALLPESPEAQAELGEYLFHFGAANGIPDPLPEAQAQFERSLSLDSLAGIVQHLLQIALARGDSAAIRPLWTVFDRLSENASWRRALGAVTAARIADSVLARDIANRPEQIPIGVLAVASVHASLSATALGFLGVDTIRPPGLYVVHGRPEALRSLRPSPDIDLLLAALFDGGDTTEGARAVARLSAVPSNADSGTIAGRGCLTALWMLWRRLVAAYDGPLLRRHGWGLCAASLDALEARRSGSPVLERMLQAADSALRWNLHNGASGNWDIAHIVVARLWEERGNPRRALEAWRLTPRGIVVGFHEALDAREQGRLAAQLGDTASAIRAYRRYLDFRRDAEPALIPQRDSVRAALAALERR